MSVKSNRKAKFVTSILIGGALGSLGALIFGRRGRKKTMTQKAQDAYLHTKDKVDEVLGKPKKRGLINKFFGKKG